MRHPILIALLAACAPEGANEQTCTLIGCTSTLEVTLDHSLDLSAGPYQVNLTTPLNEIRCSVGPDAEGSESCFGFRFTDLSWTADRVTITLTQPFYDTELNPDATPFERVQVSVKQGDVELDALDLLVDAGNAQQPNGPECGPTCWQATAEGTVTTDAR